MTDTKTLVIFMDGTWQTPEQEGFQDKHNPTNIPKLQELISYKKGGKTQFTRYANGVGASNNFFKRTFGGAFGVGLSDKIVRMYRYLADNYVPGDKIILVGYSRGAYSVRSLAGMINKVGLVDWKKYARHKNISLAKLKDDRALRMKVARRAYRLYKDDQETVKLLRKMGQAVPEEFSPSHPYAVDLRKRFSHTHENGDITTRIEALCCFDTVGSLGIPKYILEDLSKLYNEKYDFHDTTLGWVIKRAFHAVAIDERRANFELTQMEAGHSGASLEQKWFSGGHGIGGGFNPRFASPDSTSGPLDNGLAEIAGLWMGQCLQAVGVEMKSDWQKSFAPDFKAQANNIFYNNKLSLGPDTVRDIQPTDTIDDCVFKRIEHIPDYRPESMKRANRLP